MPDQEPKFQINQQVIYKGRPGIQSGTITKIRWSQAKEWSYTVNTMTGTLKETDILYYTDGLKWQSTTTDTSYPTDNSGSDNTAPLTAGLLGKTRRIT